MGRGAVVALAIGIVGALACGGGGEPAADLGARQTWSRGVTFEYPGNWRVTEEIEPGELSATTWTVETPGNAVLIVQDLPNGLGFDEMVDTYLGGIREQVASMGMSFAETARRPIGRQLIGAPQRGMNIAYEIGVLGVEVPHTVDLFHVPRGERALVVVAQVADEDRAKVDAGFELVLDSLMW